MIILFVALTLNIHIYVRNGIRHNRKYHIYRFHGHYIWVNCIQIVDGLASHNHSCTAFPNRQLNCRWFQSGRFLLFETNLLDFVDKK